MEVAMRNNCKEKEREREWWNSILEFGNQFGYSLEGWWILNSGMDWAQDERKRQLTVPYEQSHAAAALWDKAGVRSQKASELLGLKEASIAA